jgi:hypothetical protein
MWPTSLLLFKSVSNPLKLVVTWRYKRVDMTCPVFPPEYNCSIADDTDSGNLDAMKRNHQSVSLFQTSGRIARLSLRLNTGHRFVRFNKNFFWCSAVIIDGEAEDVKTADVYSLSSSPQNLHEQFVALTVFLIVIIQSRYYEQSISSLSFQKVHK